MNEANPVLFSAPFTKHFTMNGNPVTVDCERGHGADEPDPLTLKCPDCGLPFVIAQCVLLMATLNIRKMTVDGCELIRVR